MESIAYLVSLTIGGKDSSKHRNKKIQTFRTFSRKQIYVNFSISRCQYMYSMILNRFCSMKLFQKICSSVIFSKKVIFFANYEHKMSDCVSFVYFF